MNHFSPFSNDTWAILSFLAVGLDGKAAVTLTASKRGLTLKIGKVVIGRGKDAAALCRDYALTLENQRAALASFQAKLDRIKKR